jgi:phosphoribosylformylglycinamidine synthase PurS subunit
MKCGIKIMPREVILDTQGRVVESYLLSQGFHIQNCRIGKFIELQLNSADANLTQAEVQIEIKKMMQQGLYNPLTETYELIDA